MLKKDDWACHSLFRVSKRNEETCATASIQLSLTSQQYWPWDKRSNKMFKGKTA
jgi:hypothetical protein